MKKNKEKTKSGKCSKQEWVKSHPFETFFLVLGTLFAVYAAFSFLIGYSLFGRHKSCDDWHPGMTNEEKIMASLKWVNKFDSVVFELTDPVSRNTYRSNGKQIPYRNTEVILQFQSDCCHVYEKNSALTDQPSEVLPEGDEGVVVLRYTGRYEDSRGDIQTAPIFEYDDLNTCK